MIYLVPAAAVIALIFAVVFAMQVRKEPEGTDRMKEIAAAIREGAAALYQKWDSISIESHHFSFVITYVPIAMEMYAGENLTRIIESFTNTSNDFYQKFFAAKVTSYSFIHYAKLLFYNKFDRRRKTPAVVLDCYADFVLVFLRLFKALLSKSGFISSRLFTPYLDSTVSSDTPVLSSSK